MAAAGEPMPGQRCPGIRFFEGRPAPSALRIELASAELAAAGQQQGAD
jgi:hypothetical protein